MSATILSTPCFFDLRDRRGDVGDVVADQHVRAGRGNLVGVVRDRPDDADLLAADVEHDERLDPVAELGAGAGGDVRGHDGKLHLVEEGGQPVLAVVELVVADGHRVELHQVQEFGFGRALVGRVEQRALEIVAGVQQQHVLAGQRLALRVDRGLQPGDAAEALVLAFLFRRAGGVELVDRLDAGMQVVDVQDVEFVVGEGRSPGKGEQRGGQQADAD